MSLKDRIGADLKDAMKAKDQLRVDTLRSAISAFSYRRIEVGRELNEADQLDAVRKLVKQRSDSIAAFQQAGRTELVEKETRERDILSAYLPRLKTADEIRAVVRDAVAAMAPEARNQGAVMKAVLPGLRGSADGAMVRAVVLEELAAQGRT
jgi:uncharacterized protein YqeY